MRRQATPAVALMLTGRDRVARSADWRVVLPCVVVASGLYVWWHLGRGWIPTDDGTLAQSAERVLRGELPHRDFDDVYTGGLACLNAAAFRMLGTNLWTLRLVLFAAFLAWVPAFYYIASRFVRALAAAAIVLLGVVWSLPNYSAAMPSWYNLFLATFGVAALCRYLEDARRRWLLLAGIAGGLSFLVKVIGLYYVAGVLLFVVFLAHAQMHRGAGPGAQRGNGYAVSISIALLLFVTTLGLLVRHQLHPAEIVQFVLPGVLVAGLLVRTEWTQAAGASTARFRALTRLLGPFLAGVSMPVAIFIVPYVRSGALGSFVHGVFVVPMRRVTFVAIPAPPLTTMLALLPFATLGWLAHRTGGRMTKRETVLLVFVLALLLRATGGNGALYRTIWYAVQALPPVIVSIGVVMLARGGDADARSSLHRARTMLLLAVTALCSLVQFPYAHALYFSYIAPLVILATVAVYSGMRRQIQVVPGLLLVFFAGFAVLRTNSARIAGVGDWYQPKQQVAPLGIDRGGIEVPRSDSVLYDSLVTQLRAHARGGYTWASPDSPEVYFLSGLRNPTRTLFEVFDDSTNREVRVLHALDAHGISAVVLSSPVTSLPISPGMFAQLKLRYPQSRYVGPFQLRWRD